VRWTLSWVAIVAAGCANAPPPAENPSAPVPPQSDAQQTLEARALEQAEAKCASEGKKAEARRVDNVTVYDCITPADAAAGTTGGAKPQ
jgi:hypothetical protein